MDKVIGFRVISNAKIGDLSPEVVGVGTASVETVVVCRDNGCQHLPLSATERRFAVHERAIHVHRRLENARILAHNADNVPNPPGALDGGIVLLLEKASRFFVSKNFNPGHVTRLAIQLINGPSVPVAQRRCECNYQAPVCCSSARGCPVFQALALGYVHRVPRRDTR